MVAALSALPDIAGKAAQLVARQMAIMVVGRLGAMAEQRPSDPIGQAGANGAGVVAVTKDATVGELTGQTGLMKNRLQPPAGRPATVGPETPVCADRKPAEGTDEAFGDRHSPQTGLPPLFEGVQHHEAVVAVDMFALQGNGLRQAASCPIKQLTQDAGGGVRRFGCLQQLPFLPGCQCR